MSKEQLPRTGSIAFRSHEEQPVDPDMLARIDAARAHPSPAIPHEDILREFGV